MMGFRGLAALALLCTVAACAVTRTDGVARLGPDPVVSGGTYSSGGGLSVAADLRPAEGRTLVCGVWALSPQQSALTKLAEQQVLSSGAIYAGGARLVSGLLYFRRVDPAPTYAGQEANCLLSDRPWRPGDEKLRPEIYLPQQIVARESESSIGIGGFTVLFRPTGPGAGEG